MIDIKRSDDIRKMISERWGWNIKWYWYQEMIGKNGMFWWRLHLDRCWGVAQKDGGGTLSKKKIDHENDLRIGHYRTVSKKQRYHENDIWIGHYRTEGGHSSTRRVQSIPGVIGDYLAGVQSSPGAMGDYTSADSGLSYNEPTENGYISAIDIFSKLWFLLITGNPLGF